MVESLFCLKFAEDNAKKSQRIMREGKDYMDE